MAQTGFLMAFLIASSFFHIHIRVLESNLTNLYFREQLPVW